MTLYLPGIHEPDQQAAELFEGKPGTVVFAEAIGSNPNDQSGNDYSWWRDRGFRVLVRLNNGWRPDGTIPAPALYEAFAQRCANFVRASKGCSEWIIGNEPNHINEHPQGKVIKPGDYARCFALCRTAIRQVQPRARLIIAAIAPWDQTSGDWLQYWGDMLRAIVALGAVDEEMGIALHTYTQGTSPDLIDSDEQRHGWFWHFRVFEQQIAAIPDAMRHLPLDITETDQIEPWANVNSGWVKRAMQRVDAWNQQPGTQKIRSVVLYRWPRYDTVFSFADKGGVKDDFREACRMGIASPIVVAAREPGKPGAAAEGSTSPAKAAPSEASSSPLPPRDIDPRADARGTSIQMPNVGPGQQMWMVKRLYTPDEAGSRALGPDRHVLANVLVDGQRQVDMPLLVTWGNGGSEERATIHTKNNPGFEFSSDHALTPGDFTIEVADGKPSERVVGIKMGAQTEQGWNPGAHTSTLVDFELVTVPAATTPPPATEQPADTMYVIAPNGANLRELSSTQSNILIAIPYGEAVERRGFALATDGATWVAARYGIQTGWIRADLLGDKQPTALPQPTLPSSNVPALVHPIADPDKRVISQVFGVNAAKYAKFKIDGHNGVDFAVVVGTPIRAVDDGVVTTAANDAEGFGNHVVVDHSWGRTAYAHLQQWSVNPGQLVTAGQLIGLSGNSGNSEGPHLHFGLRPNDSDRANGYNGYVDPLPYLQQGDGLFLPSGPKPQPTGKQAPAREQYMAWFKQYGAEYGVEWHLLAGLAYNENKYQTEPISDKGALGMMQFMPNTWADMQVQVGVSDPLDPEQAIKAAAYYLVQIRRYLYQYKKSGDVWVVAAYNWGMGAVAEAPSWANVPPETQRFADLVVECGEMLRRWEDGW